MNMHKTFTYRFFKYFRPIWYFYLSPLSLTTPIWAVSRKLSQSKKDIISYDDDYSSENSKLLDAAFQGLNRGIIMAWKKSSKMLIEGAIIDSLISKDIKNLIKCPL